MLRLQGKTWTRTLALGGILACGLVGLTGCGSKTASAVIDAHPASKLPKEGYQQFNPAQYANAPSLTKKWLRVDAATHSLTVFVSVSASNLSLNGYYHGFAEIEVPLGWKAKLSFQDKNPDISGQLAMVASGKRGSSTVTPAISEAITPTASVDNASKPPTVQFTPTKSGTYKLEFLPTVQSGTWLWFVVDSKSATPQVKLRQIG